MPKIFLSTGMAETIGESVYRPRQLRLGERRGETATLLRTLKESASSFPPELDSFRILPSLVTALEYGGASGATIVPLGLWFGKHVSLDGYMNIILGPFITLFANPDRGR
ncbi:hypothetical protein OG21DRAFT_1507290 [Imleria badia]|nr:hypothetical protein OG21DRAFT_1507290 [Imleria badia]